MLKSAISLSDILAQTAFIFFSAWKGNSCVGFVNKSFT